jgi:hypothetical protein
MIEHSESGTMLTGDAISFFRMAAQLSALKFRVKTGMELSRRLPILGMVKREYNLKGNAAKVLALFEPIVEAARAKQLHVVPLPDDPPKVKPLPLNKKPDFVYWPTTSKGEGWLLGKVSPDVEGYETTMNYVPGSIDEAEAYCQKEAAGRGISKAQLQACVGSSMFPASYFHQLNFDAERNGKPKKKGGRNGTKRKR